VEKFGQLKEWSAAALLALIAFAIIIGVFDKLILPTYTRHGAQVEVPSVVRLNLAEAKSLLENSGYTMVVDKELNSNDAPEGTVIDQDPKPQSITKPGRRVYITVSLGEKLIGMPNLVGKAAQDAIYAAQNAGIPISEANISYENSDYYPSGVVMSQSVQPGVNFGKDTQVYLKVSLGNLPGQFPVPNLIGMPLDRAKKLIVISGFSIGSITAQARPDFLPNTVISQTPPADSTADKSDPVNLVVSTLKGKAHK
jgi:eukaryotic-like serine/threonine-protein kinase